MLQRAQTPVWAMCYAGAQSPKSSETKHSSERRRHAQLCRPDQARIALVNTALTAAGMWALAIPGIGLLSLFVFICSFIPIAGVFISTAPVAFVALTEYGFLKARARA